MENDSDYEMVMPFVTVASKGGPHDDQSYCAGWEMGALDARLRALSLIWGTPSAPTVISVASRPQTDLIAMKHGFVATFTETEVPEYLRVSFRPETTVSE